MSPLGPILGEEVKVPLQDRRHVLLQVRTADPFFRYDHLRSEQTTSPHLAEDIIDNNGETKIKQKIEKNEDENENGIISGERQTERISGNHCVSNNRIKRITSKSEEDDDEEMDDDDEELEKRNGSFHDDEDDDEDVEVDVCRDGDESNPSSPVDLTASSRCSDQFLHHPFASRGLHSFNCLQNGASGIGVSGQGGHSVFLSGHASNVSTTLVTVCSASNVTETNGPSGGNTTTTSSSVQSNKRGLAFSVENILDPNKFTGGRVIHGRIQHRRRRRAGSVQEGNFCLTEFYMKNNSHFEKQNNFVSNLEIFLISFTNFYIFINKI